MGLAVLDACFDLDLLMSDFKEGDAGGVVDASPPDFTPGDAGARADLQTPGPSGCADGQGANVGGNSPYAVWTCPGVFAGGNLAGRCAEAFTVCHAVAVGDVVCNGISGQFIGRKGYRQPGPFPPDGSQASYTWDGGGTQLRGIMYCGQLAGGYTAPAGAGGFFRVLQCDSGASPGVSSYACPVAAGSDADFDLVTNSAPSNGVLCCPKSSQ